MINTESLASYYKNLVTVLIREHGEHETMKAGGATPGLPRHISKYPSAKIATIAGVDTREVLSSLSNNTLALSKLARNQVAEMVQAVALSQNEQQLKEQKAVREQGMTDDGEERMERLRRERTQDKIRVCRIFLSTAKFEKQRLAKYHEETKQTDTESKFRMFLYRNTVISATVDGAPVEKPYKVLEIKTTLDSQELRYHKTGPPPIPMGHIHGDVDKKLQFCKTLDFTREDRAALADGRVRIEFLRTQPRRNIKYEFDTDQLKIFSVLLSIARNKQIRRNPRTFEDATADAFHVDTDPPAPPVFPSIVTASDQKLKHMIDSFNVGGSTSKRYPG